MTNFERNQYPDIETREPQDAKISCSRACKNLSTPGDSLGTDLLHEEEHSTGADNAASCPLPNPPWTCNSHLGEIILEPIIGNGLTCSNRSVQAHAGTLQSRRQALGESLALHRANTIAAGAGPLSDSVRSPIMKMESCSTPFAPFWIAWLIAPLVQTKHLARRPWPLARRTGPIF